MEKNAKKKIIQERKSSKEDIKRRIEFWFVAQERSLFAAGAKIQFSLVFFLNFSDQEQAFHYFFL